MCNVQTETFSEESALHTPQLLDHWDRGKTPKRPSMAPFFAEQRPVPLAAGQSDQGWKWPHQQGRQVMCSAGTKWIDVAKRGANHERAWQPGRECNSFLQ